jgi:hypothetical protein
MDGCMNEEGEGLTSRSMASAAAAARVFGWLETDPI